MANATRRSILGQTAAFVTPAAFFGLFPDTSDASGPEDVMRMASLTLAKACLKPADNKEFAQFLSASQVIGNPMADTGNAFHNHFSFQGTSKNPLFPAQRPGIAS